MLDCYSPLAQLLLSNVDQVPDTSSSLFDLINAHKPTREGHVNNEDIQSLSDLTSARLTLKDDDSSDSSNSSDSCTFSSNSFDSNGISDRDSSSFNTLEEYTRSFLDSNSESSFLKHKASKESVGQESRADVISEKLSNIQIRDCNQTETRKIDLTAALLGSPENTSTASSTECGTRLTKCIFYPLEECVIDISALAERGNLCNDEDLSNFGCVISRKWNRNMLPKKCKPSRPMPYNIGQCFKFDTPSPDDINLKARNRTTSG